MNQPLIAALKATLADPLAQFRAEDRPLAHVGFDVPLDVLLASGRPFCHLPWRKDRATPHADRWLETAFPGWARSIAEDWLCGAFDRFERVIFTRGDDASQRLYYYLCELQRRGIAGGPTPCIFDVAMIRRATSVTHCERALRTLLAELQIDPAALAGGIAQANIQRAWFARLDSERSGLGHLYENIARAALFRDFSQVLDPGMLLPTRRARRVVLAGSVPPDDMFHRAVEAIGWNIVDERHQLSLVRHGAPVDDTADEAIAALAQHCNARGFGARAFGERAASLVDATRRVAAEAVVLWLTEEDESLAWHVARQRAALTQAAIPHLVLTRRRWDGGDDAAELMCRFLHSLERS
jgi:hypothetical protein